MELLPTKPVSADILQWRGKTTKDGFSAGMTQPPILQFTKRSKFNDIDTNHDKTLSEYEIRSQLYKEYREEMENSGKKP